MQQKILEKIVKFLSLKYSELNKIPIKYEIRKTGKIPNISKSEVLRIE